MNKNNNWKSTAVTVFVTLVVLLGLGYILAQTSPQNAKQAAGGDSMHGESQGAPNTAQLDALVGKPLPEIQLTDKSGKTYTAADFKGKFTVLFFNEGLMCYPACWNQISAFGSDQRFNSSEVQALSVVTDSAKNWKRAITQMPELAKATTLFDGNADASDKLGMLAANSSMHRGSLPGHTYVLIDKEGIVRYVFDDPNMAIANDSLFNKIQELSK